MKMKNKNMYYKLYEIKNNIESSGKSERRKMENQSGYCIHKKFECDTRAY